MADDGLEVKGMREFRAGLRYAGGPGMTKWIAAGHKGIATKYLGKIKARANTTYRPSARISRALTARGSQTKASIALLPNRDPRIFGAEFGAAKHVVFGRGTLAAQMSSRVFPAWTGNQWVPGEAPAAGVGTAVFPVLRESQEDITADYLTYIEEAFVQAFPEGL